MCVCVCVWRRLLKATVLYRLDSKSLCLALILTLFSVACSVGYWDVYDVLMKVCDVMCVCVCVDVLSHRSLTMCPMYVVVPLWDVRAYWAKCLEIYLKLVHALCSLSLPMHACMHACICVCVCVCVTPHNHCE